MFLSSPEEACPCQFNVDEGSAEIEGPAFLFGFPLGELTVHPGMTVK